MERLAMTFDNSNGRMAEQIQVYLDRGWEIEHMTGGATHYSLRALIIFTKDTRDE